MGVTPKGLTHGRYTSLRLYWAVYVKAVLDEVVSLRWYAATFISNNFDKAKEWMSSADALEEFGTLKNYKSTTMTQSQAKEAWSKAYGKDLNDPKVMDEIYHVVAEMRRMELERQGKLAQTEAKLKQFKDKRRRRGQR